jgi:protoporphyrin/coproporphyrin ferrochelatase
MTSPIGVLLLAYGSPESLDDVEPYFRHIRGGRTPSPAAVQHLRDRYELVGGGTPLLRLTTDTARGLQDALDRRAPGAFRTYVAMKHWHPFIGDVVPRIAADGVRRLIVIVLAPHYSRMSIGAYRESLDRALAGLDAPLDVTFVESWHLALGFIAMIGDRVRTALASVPAPIRGATHVIFSAHSLPVRIRSWNDPYESQLQASCEAVARYAGLRHWSFAWQSAAVTGEPWLGPDILEHLEELRGAGVQSVVSVPIGFVCEHLEVLYDIDHAAARTASELGMTLRRVEMPNASPELIAVLQTIVMQADAAALAPA